MGVMGGKIRKLVFGQPCPPKAPLQSDLGSNPDLLLTSCVMLGRWLNFSEPRFPSHLYTGWKQTTRQTQSSDEGFTRWYHL